MFKYFIFISIFFTGLSDYKAQVNPLELKPENEKKFSPYMAWRHGGQNGLAEFKKEKPYDYLKELWYYSESFYVKRNHLSEGVTLDESIIDISRFEQHRKANEPFILEMPGFKDALVLLPIKDLIYIPAK